MNNPNYSFKLPRLKSILQLCINARAGKQGRTIHAYIVTNGFESSMNLGTKLMICFVKVRDMVSARKMFDKIPKRDAVPWTVVVSGYTQNGFYEDALVVFSAMVVTGVRANMFTYGSALRACTAMRWLEGGRQIQGCSLKGRFGDDLIVKSALLDLYGKCGRIEDAWFLFDEMEKRDVVSWNVMIGGFAVQGLWTIRFGCFG